MKNLKNLQQVISNFGMGKPGPAKVMFNLLANQNPQMGQILQMLNGLDSKGAKSKIQDMAEKGVFTKEQLVNFENIAKQAGFDDNAINQIEDSIHFKSNKNRW